QPTARQNARYNKTEYALVGIVVIKLSACFKTHLIKAFQARSNRHFPEQNVALMKIGIFSSPPRNATRHPE
ncbi:MAG: hypothetical protein VYD85_00740, partial [Pseudomonadota bacterium]|nr:hypothetical protein [Pseudomonadota bacterium]